MHVQTPPHPVLAGAGGLLCGAVRFSVAQRHRPAGFRHGVRHDLRRPSQAGRVASFLKLVLFLGDPYSFQSSVLYAPLLSYPGLASGALPRHGAELCAPPALAVDGHAPGGPAALVPPDRRGPAPAPVHRVHPLFPRGHLLYAPPYSRLLPLRPHPVPERALHPPRPRAAAGGSLGPLRGGGAMRLSLPVPVFPSDGDGRRVPAHAARPRCARCPAAERLPPVAGHGAGGTGPQPLCPRPP